MGIIVVVLTFVFPDGGGITADHDTGNCILSVCANGAIGFYESAQIHGSGFWYPQWVNQTIFYGSMAAGKAEYVVDSYYNSGGNDDHDWVLVDSLYRQEPPIFNLQEYWCRYDDSGHPRPKGLECFQYSVADPDPLYDDFVVIEFIYKNNGPEDIDSIYSAVFCDFDISNATDNYGRTDSILNTAYLMASKTNSNPTVGIVYLGSRPDPEIGIANLSMIKHEVSPIPPDTFKLRYMDGTYHYPESDRQYDWSCVVSVGTFDVPKGARRHCAFALVGGSSESEYLEHVRNAHQWYDSLFPKVAEEPKGRLKTKFSATILNDLLIINYETDISRKIKIALYDVIGREVARIFSGYTRGRKMITRNISRIPNGIYFLNLESEQERISKKFIIIR